MPIFDRIKFDGASNNESWLVYKDKRENITLGSQLIVGIGQEAIFIKGGRAQDIFTPGTYTLQTGNLPILKKLVGRAFGGNTPFAAEVVFINTTNNISMKWGTPAQINMEDPKYKLVIGLRAHGKFSVKVDDTKTFINQLIGTVHLNSGFNHDIIWQKFNPLINTKFQSLLMKFMKQNNLSFLDIAAYYDEVSELTLKEMKEDFKDSGLELVNFFVESVSPPPSDYEILKDKRKKDLVGEARSQRERILDIVENNPDSETIRNLVNSISWGSTNNVSVPPATSQNTSNMMTCPHCNNSVAVGSNFCSHCGHQLPQQRFCSNCGHVLTQGARFCSSCGERV